MDELNWEEVETIIDEVLDLPQHQRKAYIEEKCGNNEQLKGTITELLESIFESEGWLEDLQTHKYGFYDVSSDIETLGQDYNFEGKQVGAYTIKEQIGQGGMGRVYLAERSDDTFEHQVAIKIIRHNKATQTNIQRFKQEQRILASLNHTGIAQLFDAGITDDGFPYIIMEYVLGIPIIEYCRQNNITLKKRIELFKQVLDAIQHAHENLIIHRDLKPDNILVDDNGNVKILDFGISKLLEDDNELSLTRTGSRILTPKYAAPEQIKQANITTATDLYSLGILFYELLCDSPPFNLHDRTTYEAEQIILTESPAKPSSKASSKQLSQKLRGDLNAIALKAIRKEAEQRYRVATEFIDDLNNFLKGLPVSARTDTFRYRANKFIGRHKQSLSAAAVILIVIIGLSTFYTWQIAEERNLAQQEAQKAENISGFLLTLFEANFPGTTGGKEVTAQELLQEGRQKADQIIDETMRANMLSVIGQAYFKLGYRDSALTILQESESLIKKAQGNNSLEYADINYNIGQAHDVYSDLALPYFQKSYKIRSEFLGNDHPKTAESLLRIGETKSSLGEVDSARYYVDQAKQSIEKSASSNQSAALEININEETAGIHQRDENYEEAEQIYLDLLSRSESDLQTDSLTISRWHQNIAWTYIPRQQFKKAIPHLESALEITESILGKGHESTLKVRNDLAGVNSDLGNLDRFQSLSEENIEYTIARYGNNHRMTCQANSAYGLQLTLYEVFDKGEKYLRESIDSCSQAMGEEHLWTAFVTAGLSTNLELNNKLAESDKYFKKSYTIFKDRKEEFNRVNKRQISLILRIYDKVDPSNIKKIERFKSLIQDKS
ncbi:MAG: protein kinase domain-containing protein [Bacteroidota bacterium]